MILKRKARKLREKLARSMAKRALGAVTILPDPQIGHSTKKPKSVTMDIGISNMRSTSILCNPRESNNDHGKAVALRPHPAASVSAN